MWKKYAEVKCVSIHMSSLLCSVSAVRLRLCQQARRFLLVQKTFTEACDNSPLEKYRYYVTTFTGFRPGAGTSADVVVTLIGTKRDSDPHVIQVRNFYWKAFQDFCKIFERLSGKPLLEEQLLKLA